MHRSDQSGQPAGPRARRAAILAALAAVALAGLGMPGTARATITPGNSSTASTQSASSLTIQAPAGVAAGQVLVAVVSTSGTGTITTPSGWTAIQTTATSLRQTAYYHVAASGDQSAWTWVLSSPAPTSAGMTAYSGVNTVAPVDASATGSGTGTSAIAPSVTPHSSGDRVIAAVSHLAGSQAGVTPASGTTERYDIADTEAADFAQTGTAATATKTAKLPASAAWITQTIALNDAATAALSVAAAGTPSLTANLTAGDQTVTYALPLAVQDTRTGSSAATGWHLAVTSTTLTSGTHTLSTSASQVTAAAGSCDDGASCTAPSDTVSYPFTVPAASTAPATAKLYDAAAHTGTGAMTITPTVAVAIPANAYAGTYTSTLTVSIASGP